MIVQVARRVVGKDLRIEWRSRVLLNQVLPFAVIVMVLFAFAVDDDRVLAQVAPGLIWLATLFSTLVMVQRTFAVESADGALDALRLAGVDAPGIFAGKALALTIQLLVLDVVLVGGALVLYRTELNTRQPWGALVLLITTVVLATVGLACVGTIYGGLAAGANGRETLLPLLMFPVVAPVVIGATRATEAAFGVEDTPVSEGWPWVGVLALFAGVFAAGGWLAFGSLIDE
jgi:heme exporter protein B